MQKAVINNDGVVENIILADDGFMLHDKILVPIGQESVKIGDTFKNGEFVPQIEPETEVIAYEPSATAVLLKALEDKLQITPEEKEAAALALKQAKD